MYHGDAECTEAVREFVRDAVDAAEPVLVALPGDSLERVRAAVGDAGPEARFEDMREVGRNPSCLLPLIEEWVHAHEAGGARVRVVSEAIWPGRSYPETVECLRHEALLNSALAEANATIMCPYDAERLDPNTLTGAELTHPTVVEHGERRPSSAYRAPVDGDLERRWPLEPPTEPVSEHELSSTLGELRQAVADDPLVAGLSDARRNDLVLAVNEAATNAVRHGDGACTARIWHDGRGVVAEVSSRSGVDDPLAGRCVRPEPEALSGRGLWLINEICDLVELRAGERGMTLRMHMSDAA